MSEPTPSLFVAVPVYQHVDPAFAASLLSLQRQLIASGISHDFLIYRGSADIVKVRDRLAAAFLASPYTHTLMLDADEEIDPRTILRMVSFEARYRPGVVGAPYPRKDHRQPKWTVPTLSGEIEVRDGFVKVDWCGTGLLLVAREVFERMAAITPRVLDEYSPEPRGTFHHFFGELVVKEPDGIDRALPEDLSFLRRWAQLNGEVWVDATARVRHWGPFPYDAGCTLLEFLGGESAATPTAGARE